MEEGPLDDLWAFNTKAKTWTCVMEHTEEKGGPSKRSFHQMVRKGGREGGREGGKEGGLRRSRVCLCHSIRSLNSVHIAHYSSLLSFSC